MPTVILPLNKKLGQAENLATGQLGNHLAIRCLPSEKPLLTGVSATWQLGNAVFFIAKLKAFIHAGLSLATFPYIYTITAAKPCGGIYL